MDVRLVGVAGTEPSCARLEGDCALCMTRGSLKTTSWTSALGHLQTWFRRTALFLICYLVGASISTLAEELRATELQRNCSLLGDPPDELTREEANLVLRCVSWWEGCLDRLKTEKGLFPKQSPICLPEDATVGRLIHFYLRYLHDNPPPLSQPAYVAADLALRQFPCPPDN
jgi:Rap1a immunity proteins